MREKLRKLEISDNTIKQMIEMCPYIEDLSDEEIEEKINFLKEIGCDYIQIKNIISSNAQFLDRLSTDLKCLVEKLEEYGFDTLNILFDGNPYILNLDDFEIEGYIENRIENGEKLEDIVDEMSSNPYIFEEI